MPRDVSGNYTLPLSNPVADGTIIDVNWANPTMSDIAAQLNNVFTRDGLLGPLTSFGVIDGTLALPGLNFIAQTNVGLYRPSNNVLGIAVGGVERARFDTAGMGVVGGVVATGPTGIPATFWAKSPAGQVASLRMAANGGLIGTDSFDLYQDTGGEAYLANLKVKPIYFKVGTNLVGAAGITGVDAYYRVNGESSNLVLNKTLAARWNNINGVLNDVMQWQICMGDSASGGANGGSNFHLSRFNDAGTLIAPDVIFADRLSGNTVIPKLFMDAGYTWGFAEDATNRVFSFANNYYWIYTKASGALSWNYGGGGGEPAVNFIMFRDGTFNTKRLQAAGSIIIESGSPGPYLYYRWAPDWFWRWNSGTGDLEWVLYPNNGNLVMRAADKAFIWWTGPAYKAGGGMWSDTSDRRIKRNIRDYTQGLAAILALRPRLFNYMAGIDRDETKDFIGLIAQEAQEVMPELIGEEHLAFHKERGRFVDFPEDSLLTIDPTGVFYALVNAVREVAALIEGLDVRLTNLEGAI